MNLGDTQPVWHVIGPPTRSSAGEWWCVHSYEDARRTARTMGVARIFEGKETYSELPGGLKFWDVKRPEWVEAESAVQFARRV